MPQSFKIWYAFLGGALAWTLHLMGSYAISEGLCRTQTSTITLLGLSLMIWCLILLTLFAVALTLSALWLSRRQHLSSLANVSQQQDEISLFMSRSSLLSNSLFLAVIIAQSFPILILRGNC